MASTRKQPVQSSSRIAGHLRGIPIEVRDDITPGKMYFLNDEWQEFTRSSNETQKWRAKVYNTLRAFLGRFQRNKREG